MEAGPGGGNGRRGRRAQGWALPPGRRSPLRAGLGREGALAPKPGGPGGSLPFRI